MIEWRAVTEPGSVVGLKASRLGRLRASGLRVPPGVVGVGPLDPGKIAPPAIPGVADGEPLVLRSSSPDEDRRGRSLAGAYQTRLSVLPDGFDASFREVRASGPPDLPVLVQPMVNAVYSGVLQTRSPLSPRHWVVEAAPGAGRIVGGTGHASIRYLRSNTPDAESTIVALRGARPAWAQELEAAARAVEEILRFSGTSVEFAVDHADRVWILQARPLPVATAERDPATRRPA